MEDVPEKDPSLAAEIIGLLAIRLYFYRPEVIVPVPTGANRWASVVARYMQVGYAELEWADKTSRQLKFIDKNSHQLASQAEKIALIDDVYTSGSSLGVTAHLPEINGKVVVAGVIWDRSREKSSLEFPIERIVHSHIPLYVEDA